MLGLRLAWLSHESAVHLPSRHLVPGQTCCEPHSERERRPFGVGVKRSCGAMTLCVFVCLEGKASEAGAAEQPVLAGQLSTVATSPRLTPALTPQQKTSFAAGPPADGGQFLFRPELGTWRFSRHEEARSS